MAWGQGSSQQQAKQSALEPTLFNSFINGTECILRKYMDDSTLGRVADTINGRGSFQVTLIKPEDWANRKQSSAKTTDVSPWSRLQTDCLSSSWIQATKCTLITCKINCILSYTGSGVVSTEGSYYLPIFCNGKAALTTVSPISLLPRFKRDTEKLEMVPWRAINMARA